MKVGQEIGKTREYRTFLAVTTMRLYIRQLWVVTSCRLVKNCKRVWRRCCLLRAQAVQKEFSDLTLKLKALGYTQTSINTSWQSVGKKEEGLILCLWFRASLIYIYNCPTRCNTKQSIYYSASSLYMFRVSTTPITRSTQNCNYSLRYCAATSHQRGKIGQVGGR